MLVFLELNGMEMECSEEELIALGLGIASGEIEEKDVDIWIVTHNRGEWADKCWEKATTCNLIFYIAWFYHYIDREWK